MTFNELHSGDWFRRDFKQGDPLMTALFAGTGVANMVFKKLDMFHAVNTLGMIEHFHPIEEVIFIEQQPKNWPEGI